MIAFADAAISAEPRRFRALAADAIRGIGWPQIRVAMLFGFTATVIITAMHISFLVTIWTTMPVPTLVLGDLIATQIKALGLLVAVVVADRVVDDGGPRILTYTVAAFGGCVLGFVVAYPFAMTWDGWLLPQNWPADRPQFFGKAKYINFFVVKLMTWLTLGVPAVFLYADRRAALQTEARLRAAELDRIRRSRLALESRLQAMQARIEPQFLFNTLAQVRELYEADAARGARMLDELIAYLRAAMPKMRDTSSTLGQEVELARAYLAIVKVRLGNRFSFSIDVPDGDRSARVPPMMLLPLVDHAVRKDDPAPAHSIAIRGAVGDGKISLAIIDSGNAFATEDAAIAGIRDRLAALFGTQASLKLVRRDGGDETEVVLEMPLESDVADPATQRSSARRAT